MSTLHSADHGPLAASIARLTASEDQVRRILVAAGLRPERITLPSGALETQWWNALQHANAHGAAALSRLLCCAVGEMPGLRDESHGLLRKYGADPAGLPQAEGTRPAAPAQAPQDAGRRRVLFLSANALTTRRLDIEEEHHHLARSLREALGRDAYDFRTELGVRPRDLADILRRHRLEANGKIVLHFSGHGRGGGPGLLMRGDDGQDRAVAAPAFGRLVRAARESLGLVVLSACHSDGHAQESATHTGAAIGMADAISDRSAIVFAQVFYRAWASGAGLVGAFDEACGAIDLEGLPGWDVPVLFRVSEGGRMTRRRGQVEEDVE